MSDQGKNDRENLDPGETHVATNAAAPSPSKAKSSSSNKLEQNPLQPGAAAKRLLAQDDARMMFQYEAEPIGLFGRLRRYGWTTLRYLTQTEVHTYAFSVAANSVSYTHLTLPTKRIV